MRELEDSERAARLRAAVNAEMAGDAWSHIAPDPEDWASVWHTMVATYADAILRYGEHWATCPARRNDRAACDCGWDEWHTRAIRQGL